MSVERLRYVSEDTRVSFELQTSLPIFREKYHSAELGTCLLVGLFNQKARLELLDGRRYRTLGPRKIDNYPNDLVYPVVHMPDKSEAFLLHSPLHFQKGSVPRLRFSTQLDGHDYVFRQISAGQRGFELWDGMEMNKLVRREAPTKLMPDLSVLYPVPAVLLLLFPWLDSQTIMYRQT
jgi:hypothetical protein